ncbi:hypothetical protein TWF788_008339 [Orbilia oligospora]|uniref:Uncharacterized protein n=1 Tax=Orbilia oligospora TaxID=2813651 RepID=A0A7C8PRA7_ORBOL|nr:hypothetical protein TWF788_008339 [Orbilia oligospora]
MSVTRKNTKKSQIYGNFCPVLGDMDELDFDDLDVRRYCRDVERLIGREGRLRESTNKRKSEKGTIDTLTDLEEIEYLEEVEYLEEIEVLRAPFKGHHQNPPKKPKPERPREVPAREGTSPAAVKPKEEYTYVYLEPNQNSQKQDKSELYHEDLSKKVKGISFNSKFWTLGRQAKKYIAGSSTCSNPSCKKEWQHNRIEIIIRGSRAPENVSVCDDWEQDQPEVLDYHVFMGNQKCESCGSLKSIQLRKKKYIKVVARQLKAWKEEVVQPPRRDIDYCGKCTRTRKCPNCKAKLKSVEGQVTSALGKLQL